MADNSKVEGAGTPSTGMGDTEKESEKVGGDEVLGKQAEHVDGEHASEELKMEGEHVAVEHMEGEQMEGEHMEGEHEEGDHTEGEHVEGEQVDGEHMEGEHVEGEHMEGEHMKGEELESEEKDEPLEEENVEEEQQYVEPPVDPTAPYDFTDSKELLREPFELRQDQLMEVEVLWEMFQNYTPAYTDLDNYITQKELVFMLKALLILPYTPEQLIELIDFCVRPPHPEGHINYDQFVRMVTVRQRDFVIEEELRAAFKVYDTQSKGFIDREELRQSLGTEGHKMHPKQLDNFMKEVDLSNDGTIGIEDAVGTLCIDLNKDDIQMLKDTLNPPLVAPEELDY